MLITEKIEIRVVSKNLNYLNSLKYDVKCGDLVKIKVDELTKNSKIKVLVMCDVCGEEKYKPYCDYLKQHSNQNFDVCNNCKCIKRKKTMLNKYGVEHALQNNKSMEKLKTTMLEKYGVENSMHNNNIKEKIKDTIKEKYGVEYFIQSKEFKNAAKKTKKEKYDNENFINIDQIKKTKKEKYGYEYYNNRDKSIETNLEKYGVENVSQSEKIKEKKKETSIKNYGVDHPLKTFEIMEKLRNTNIDNLSVPYPTMSKVVTDKILKTNIKNGRTIKMEDTEDFYKYYLLVCKYTRINKIHLLNNWDGNDYYTSEYILENFKLNSNDKKYPTIDHKKSIKYGFDNKISPEEISQIDNLCITTRSNNSSKGEKTETNFNI